MSRRPLLRSHRVVGELGPCMGILRVLMCCTELSVMLGSATKMAPVTSEGHQGQFVAGCFSISDTCTAVPAWCAVLKRCHPLCRPPERGCCLSNLRFQDEQHFNAPALAHAVIKVSSLICACRRDVSCLPKLLQGVVNMSLLKAGLLPSAIVWNFYVHTP